MTDLSTVPLGELETQTRMAIKAMPWLTEADRGLVSAALEIAAQVDAELLVGGQSATKALYLVPHLRNLLEALGGSPDARLESGVKPGGVEVDGRKSKSKPANVTSIKDRPKRPAKRA